MAARWQRDGSEMSRQDRGGDDEMRPARLQQGRGERLSSEMRRDQMGRGEAEVRGACAAGEASVLGVVPAFGLPLG